MSSSHIIYARETARPGPSDRFFAPVWRALCAVYLKSLGWRFEGDWPHHPKFVVVAAPHTSNWDGINMLAAAGYYKAKISFIGKKSLVSGPFGPLVRWLGCVPVDRDSSNDVVGQMRDAFEQADRLVLAIPPEGTRGKTRDWKSGFYHIARTANVPIVMTVLDYGARTVRVSGEIMASGDYEADLALIKSHYDGAKGKRVEKFSH